MDIFDIGSAGAVPAAAPEPYDIAQAIVRLLDGFSIEITPQEVEAAAGIATLIPAGTQVYLPFLPKAALADVVPSVARLDSEGMIPVVHVAARRLRSRDELDEGLAQLAETSRKVSVLVVAGDVDTPAGPFSESLELLETGLLEKYGITRIGITGYPEPHPVIPDREVWAALERKCDYAGTSAASFRIVSQFTFSLSALLRWESELRDRGISLPVQVSVPGPAKLRTLLAYARLCGVSASLRQLTRNRGMLAGLAAPGAPDHLLTGLARQRDDRSLIERIHFNTFGGFEQTVRWVQAVREGRFTMDGAGDGFRVG